MSAWIVPPRRPHEPHRTSEAASKESPRHATSPLISRGHRPAVRRGGTLSTAQQMQTAPDSQATLINNLLPGVVNITVFRSNGAPTTAMNAAASVPSEPKEILGSGFVIDPSGVIMTNQHVIAGAYDIQVLFSDGVRRSGHLIATSPRIDLALIKVEAKQPLPDGSLGQ